MQGGTLASRYTCRVMIDGPENDAIIALFSTKFSRSNACCTVVAVAVVVVVAVVVFVMISVATDFRNPEQCKMQVENQRTVGMPDLFQQ